MEGVTNTAGGWTVALHALLFAGAYFLGSELGYALSFGGGLGGTFWPPSGITLGVLLAAPRRQWPWFISAGAVANLLSDQLHHQSSMASAGFAAANLADPLLAALIVRRLVVEPVAFARLTDVIAAAAAAFLFSAPLVSVVGALVGEAWTESRHGFAAHWRGWWIGNATGSLVLAPVVTRALRGARRAAEVGPRVWAEAGAFLAAVAAVTVVVFSAPPASAAMPFLVYPVLLWGTLRLGPTAVGAALCLLVCLAARGTIAGSGPFASTSLSPGDRLVALQVYVGVTALSFYVLAVMWEERARAAAALRVAHASLEARHLRLLAQAPLGVVTLRPDGRVEEANPTWERLWGRAMHPDGAAVEDPRWSSFGLARLVERAAAGEVLALPDIRLDPDGAAGAGPAWIRAFAYPVKSDDGRVEEVVVVARDVTEELCAQRRLEGANAALREREGDLRRARDEAERASQVKDDFLATLSHELRSPLHAVIGWAGILRRAPDEAARAHALDAIERNAAAQARLIEDLLDVSRALAGKVTLASERVDLAEVAAHALDAVRPSADARGVALVGPPADGAGWAVRGDAARLRQVAVNLLNNAVKFTPAGGSVEVSLARHDGRVALAVRDSGQGIAPDFLPLVFERFRQADGGVNRRHGGLGLGLSIARELVERHGGSIAAHSDGPGRGATFTVTLPALDGEAGGPEAPYEPPPPGTLAGLEVLVVDDDPDSRELLLVLLGEQGCVVEGASSAGEALDRLAAFRPDVLISDIGMPGTDGYELIRRVRALARPPRWAIALTAFARPEDRAHALQAGFDDHLAKPFEQSALERALARAVRGARRAAGPES